HERSNRFYCLAEILLLKKFPQFGYIWNLLVTYISDLPRIKLQPLKYKLNKLKEKKFN
ncbi:MAG: transposase, partial [Cyanobacteria bacterium J083]